MCEQLGLQDLVNFNTQESNKLDLILTDLSQYQAAVQLSPIAQNDHCCILVNGQRIVRNKYNRQKRRIVTPERKMQ